VAIKYGNISEPVEVSAVESEWTCINAKKKKVVKCSKFEIIKNNLLLL
jgi:hypothetical protein